ncbi:hypothetical protein [Methanofollis liminatans]|nr:hypothetical protein [Methanofollis liminatans]
MRRSCLDGDGDDACTGQDTITVAPHPSPSVLLEEMFGPNDALR